MSTKETGGPAFPIDRQTALGIALHEVGPHDEAAYIEAVARLSHGMTLRDYFAAHAPEEITSLEGWSIAECARLLGLPDGVGYEWRKHYIPLVSKLRYEYADAMLKARKS